MTPLYIQLHNSFPLMVIPDTTAHFNGHPVITHTYSIFHDTQKGNPLAGRSKESTLHLEKIDDPDYFGYITFEVPDKLFTYTADGQRELSANEVQEVIEYLTNIRENPALWTQTG